MAQDRVGACPVLVRALLAVLACLALLGSGTAAAASLPRTGASAAVTAPSASSPARASMEAPGPAVLVRAGGLAVVPAPAGPGIGLLPGHGPEVAPHLVAEPQSRPPTARPASTSVPPPGSRAPPAPAGT